MEPKLLIFIGAMGWLADGQVAVSCPRPHSTTDTRAVLVAAAAAAVAFAVSPKWPFAPFANDDRVSAVRPSPPRSRPPRDLSTLRRRA